MKKSCLAAGVLALTLLAPGVAQAAAVTYRPLVGSDFTSDVNDRESNLVDKPGLDITKFRGTRTGKKITMVVRYAKLTAAPYKRFAVSLDDSHTTFSSVVTDLGVELRFEPTGRTYTAVYRSTFDRVTFESTFERVTCKGATATPDFKKDKVTFVLPVSCYTLDRDSATFATTSSAWSADHWSSGPLDGEGQPADFHDNAGDETWAWRP